MAIDTQVCFHRQLFADPVKPSWCITGPVGPLWNTNQNWLGARLLPMAVSIYPVVCVYLCCLLGTQHHCLWPNGREGLPSACPPTPTTHHLPPTHPSLISDTHDIMGVVKKQWILHGRVSYETLSVSLLYLYSISCVAIMQYRRSTAASIFQNGSHSLKYKMVGFSKSSHI